MNCKQCNEPLKHVEGRKKKVFCNVNCRNKWFYANRKQLAELALIVAENNKPENKARILKERNSAPKAPKNAKNPLIPDQRNEVPPKIEVSNKPKNLEQLKALCPKEITGLEKSAWIAENRQKYGI